jgi:hypothetical protein
MMLFSQALSGMAFQDFFEPRLAAEAPQKDIGASEDAAISRLCPIQDGLDYWQRIGRWPRGLAGPWLDPCKVKFLSKFDLCRAV